MRSHTCTKTNIKKHTKNVCLNMIEQLFITVASSESIKQILSIFDRTDSSIFESKDSQKFPLLSY